MTEHIVEARPADVTAHVIDAVAHGEWTPAEVTAAVTSEVRTDRSEVLATLWDLVSAGELTTCDCHGQLGFRLTS